MRTILDQKQVAEAVERLSEKIKADIDAEADIAVIGIRSRGEILAQRLVKDLQSYFKGEILTGILDITLYRDDLNEPRDTQPTVRATEIDFDVTDKVILLIDDVLFTGRSVRAAMDAITDFGRPKLVRLAVLIDRKKHEYPICADYAGIEMEENPDRFVRVHFIETDKEDRVIVE